LYGITGEIFIMENTMHIADLIFKKGLRYLLFALIVLSNYCLIAQENKILILNQKISIGKNYKSGKEVYATVYHYPDNIWKFDNDTVSNSILVQVRGLNKYRLRNSGDLIMYDLNHHAPLWNKSINYATESVDQQGSIILQANSSNTIRLNNWNGESLWENNNNIFYIKSELNIGLGYHNQSTSLTPNWLTAVDLKTGLPLWKRKIDLNYGIYKVIDLDDSISLLVASGLYSINLKNSNGWDYFTITGTRDYVGSPDKGEIAGVAAVGAAAVALGLLTGIFVVPTYVGSGNPLVGNILSNVLFDSTGLYFASKEKIAHIGFSGNVTWSYPIPTNLTGKSSLFIKNNLVYYINQGYGLIGNIRIGIGTPFIAAFDKTTGNRKFFNIVNEKKTQINLIKVQNDTLIIVFTNKISAYSLMNGFKIFDKPFKNELYGNLEGLLSKKEFILNKDSIFQSLVESDLSKNFLITDKNKVLKFDNQWNIIGQIDENALYLNYLEINGYTFLDHNDITILIDPNHKAMDELMINRKTTKVGSRLFSVKGKDLIESDLKEMINFNE
jgi:hypothetical protein